MEGFNSTLIILPYEDQVTSSPAYKISNPSKSANFHPTPDSQDPGSPSKPKQVQIFAPHRQKAQYQTGLVYRAFKQIFEKVNKLSREGQEASLEVSAFQIFDDKIIDIGMPDDAKKNNTVEVRNLDFEKYNMDTYEDMKATVFVKNWYYRDIDSLDDFKYFIDKWVKAQSSQGKERRQGMDMGAETNRGSQKGYEEVYLGHTVFSVLVKRKVTMTRLYIVACSPYLSDVMSYEESENPVYYGKVRRLFLGARKSNEALNKLLEICRLVKSGLDLDDHTKFPFNDWKFTKLMRNVFQTDSNINFLFSVPLMDFNPQVFSMKNNSRSGNILKQIVEAKLSQSRSHNLSSMSKMKEYDRMMAQLEFSTNVL